MATVHPQHFSHAKRFRAFVVSLFAFSSAAWAQLPEIAVEQPLGTDLVDGLTTLDYGPVFLGATSSRTFTLRNTGSGTLLNLALTKTGTASAQFTVVPATLPTSLAAGASLTFTVTFGPTGTVVGVRTAALRIASNDANENPFDIALTGSGVIPEIAVEQPTGTNLVDGSASIAFGNIASEKPSSRTVLVRNLGSGQLTGLAVTKTGVANAQFLIDTSTLPSSLAPGASAPFTVTFTPIGPNGVRAAALQIASNDANENPFDITLSGAAYSSVVDQDADGMSDWGEFQLSALGFNWQVSQPTLVTALRNGAPAAGLVTSDQVQTLRVAATLTPSALEAQQYKFTVLLDRAAPGQAFSPVSLTPSGARVTSAGTLELNFSAPDPGALFRVQTP